jgi:predicted small lipoprotein YifL
MRGPARFGSGIPRTALTGTAVVVLLVTLLSVAGCGERGSTRPSSTASAATDTAAPSRSDTTALGVTLSEPDSSAPPASAAVSEPEPEPKLEPRAGGMAALRRASAAGKHLLILFYRTDDDSTRAMREVFASAVSKFSKRASSVIVSVTDPAERELVAKYQVDRAPMPLALVVAPSGAVTGGFAGEVTKEQLSGAFVGPGTATCLKALQDNKLVLLCVQNASTRSNDAALKGAREFKADARYEKITEIVSVDPSDTTEAKFLGQLRIDPKTVAAVTAFLAPPGSVIATYTGATDKNTLVAALTAATSGGGGGG